MPKTKISEYSTTNSDNTDIESINIAEGCAPSGINNAIRELMVHLKEFQTGASGDAFTFAGGVLISGTANTITGNVLMSGTNTITGSTTATFAAGAVGTPSIAAHGDTNTGIFFPAADTIAFTEGGAEAMRINSSGNVGIGTTSPNQRLHVANAGNTYVRVNNSTSGVDIYLGADTNEGNVYVASNHPLTFLTNNTERMRINAGAPILCLSGGNTLATGTGIAFPATQSASSDANTLDDYEEGTWTPTVSGTSTAGTGTYSYQLGRYTKIGRVVHVQVYMAWSAHTGSGNMLFSNLPFTTDGTVNSAGSVAFVNNIALTASNVLTIYTTTNSTNIACNQYPVGGGAQSAVALDTSADLVYSMTYVIA